MKRNRANHWIRRADFRVYGTEYFPNGDLAKLWVSFHTFYVLQLLVETITLRERKVMVYSTRRPTLTGICIMGMMM
jgi:hypothetical protein